MGRITPAGAGNKGDTNMRQNFHFLSSDGTTRLSASRWIPDGAEPRAIVQLCHGMNSHLGRYEDFALFLAAHGLLVVGHDYLGHGQSISSPEDLGYICDERPGPRLVQDLHRLRLLTQARYPGLPYVMLGDCIGSHLLRKYLCRYGDGLAAAVLIGTGHVDPATSAFGMNIARTWAAVNRKGWHHHSKRLNDMMYTSSYDGYCLDGSDLTNSWMSRDTDMVRSYYADPLCVFPYTLNGWYAFLDTLHYSCDPAHMALIPDSLPLLLASGAQDPVCDRGEGTERAAELLRESGLHDLTVRIYEEDRHDLLHEVDRDRIQAELLDWILGHI